MNISLQNRILAVVLLLLVACMSVFSVVSYVSGLSTRKKLAMDEMRRTASLIATAHSRERELDWQKTDLYLSNILALYSEHSDSDLLELFYIMVKDESGKLAAYEVNYGLARHYNIKLTDSAGIPLDEKSYENGDGIASLIESSVPDMDTIVMPVIVNGRSMGTIELGYLVKRLAMAEKEAAAKNALALVLLCFLGTIAAVLIARPVVKSILSVVEAMKQVGGGNMNVNVAAGGSDETKALAAGLNSMAAAIERSRKEVESKTSELKESENKYRTLFQSAGDSILLLDSSGVCIDANQKAAKLFNSPVPDLVNTFIFDLVAPSGITRNFQSCPERWSGTVSVPGADPRAVETLLSRANTRNSIAVIRDVTPWREAESAILTIKKRQQKLIEDLPVGILTLDTGLQVTSCNRYMEILLDRPAYDIIGALWAELDPLFHGSGLDKELREVLDYGKEKIISDIPLETGERGVRLLELRISPFLEDPEKPPSVMIMAEDITEKVEMKRIHDELQQRMLQSQKLEAIGTLAGGIAGDFNNMLAVIMGNADYALQETDPESPYYSEIADIKNAASRAKELTSKLMAFARKGKLKESAVSINPMICDLVEFMRRGSADNIEISTVLRDDAPTVKADPNQIFQALINVCNNAVDAMPDGGTLTIESRRIKDEENRFGQDEFLLVSITDTGAGIPEWILSRIFDPFFTTKPPGSGTGLGLSIALGIIETHGGQISLSNRDGGGTRVDIYLPASGAMPGAPPILPAGEASPDSETILIIDDEAMLLRFLKNLLKKAGYNPICVLSGTEALNIISRIGPDIDLVLLDMTMPEIDGAETYRKLTGAGVSAPFVFMSAYVGETNISDLMKEINVKGFIQKPFNIERLYQTINEVLGTNKKA